MFSTKSSDEIRLELFKALYTPNKQKVVDLIEKNGIDIHQFRDQSNSILINAVNCASDCHGSKEQLEVVDYLIGRQANVNYKNANGYNALHIALAYHNLSKVSLLLIKNGHPSINDTDDKNGNSPIFTAIREYGLTWREEQKELNKLRFGIVRELLDRGAEIDQKNHHGISARKWIETIPENDKLHSLIKDHDRN